MLLEYLVNAQEEERSRLAHELTIGAGQMLTSLLVRIKALEKGDPEAIRAGLSAMLDVAAQTLEQVPRSLVPAETRISGRIRPRCDHRDAGP